MSNFLYVRTTLNVPGAGSAVHFAELEEIDSQACRLHRLIALAPNDSVAGMATPTVSAGQADLPQEIVPHPDSYAEFPDIEATFADAPSFELLWAEGAAVFPGFPESPESPEAPEFPGSGA